MQGAAVYAPEKEALVWKMKSFPGGREFLLRCKFALPSVAAEEEHQGRMPPIRVSFEIPYFTVSGIQVRLAALPISRLVSILWVVSRAHLQASCVKNLDIREGHVCIACSRAWLQGKRCLSATEVIWI